MGAISKRGEGERKKWRFNFDNYGCYIIASERERANELTVAAVERIFTSTQLTERGEDHDV
jgi:hypothetical protein